MISGRAQNTAEGCTPITPGSGPDRADVLCFCVLFAANLLAVVHGRTWLLAIAVDVVWYGQRPCGVAVRRRELRGHAVLRAAVSIPPAH